VSKTAADKRDSPEFVFGVCRDRGMFFDNLDDGEFLVEHGPFLELRFNRFRMPTGSEGMAPGLNSQLQ